MLLTHPSAVIVPQTSQLVMRLFHIFARTLGFVVLWYEIRPVSLNMFRVSLETVLVKILADYF